ncbi:glycoside hydrolase family 27 protein [bacterium]|nr:MAG: glycoside hydrolase family 27 protein [bacterium]
MAPVPPMGWNSFVSFGDSVTEEEVLANAQYMKDNLAKYGWKYVVVDYRWYDAGAKGNTAVGRAGAKLSADWYGRLTPAVQRFPSAKNNAGFKPLADKIHGMGLKFGIHIMRGIPRQAVKANHPIESSSYSAVNAADTSSTCSWCPDMYGVKANTSAAQAWYDSLFRQYAAWGVDFVKVDDLSKPYSGADISAIRRAIDKCGRPMVFSVSPGPTPVRHTRQLQNTVDMWRISGDFWDKWNKLSSQFDLMARWQGRGGGGHWPDPDFLPLGIIGHRASSGKKSWSTHLTKNEQVTMMSFWAIAPGPLFLGSNLPENDDWTLSLMTNKEVLDVNQDVGARQAKRAMYSKAKGHEAWVKPLADGTKALAIFNRSNQDGPVSVSLDDCGLPGKYQARNLWQHTDLGTMEDTISPTIPKHGSLLLQLTPMN